MPAAGLLAVLDDIATVLDDVAILTKVAAKKTAGVLGDDLALNAEQVTGVRASRELPVVWAVAKGSLVNKAILVPAALLVSAVAPWAVTPLLMVGGGFLCFEGVEKLAHKFLHSEAEEREHHAELVTAVADPEVDLVALEQQKIKGAVRTDFILSAEIVTISLGTVADAPFATRVVVLIGLSLLMTVGVYGLVAGIVKLDDLGLYLTERGRAADAGGSGGVGSAGVGSVGVGSAGVGSAGVGSAGVGSAGSGSGGLSRALGQGILKLAPLLMKLLSIAGTLAMFLVGGGILVHGIPGLSDWSHHLSESLQAVPGGGFAVSTLINLVVGVVAGAVALLSVTVVQRALGRARPAA